METENFCCSLWGWYDVVLTAFAISGIHSLRVTFPLILLEALCTKNWIKRLRVRRVRMFKRATCRRRCRRYFSWEYSKFWTKLKREGLLKWDCFFCVISYLRSGCARVSVKKLNFVKVAGSKGSLSKSTGTSESERNWALDGLGNWISGRLSNEYTGWALNWVNGVCLYQKFGERIRLPVDWGA